MYQARIYLLQCTLLTSFITAHSQPLTRVASKQINDYVTKKLASFEVQKLLAKKIITQTNKRPLFDTLSQRIELLRSCYPKVFGINEKQKSRLTRALLDSQKLGITLPPVGITLSLDKPVQVTGLSVHANKQGYMLSFQHVSHEIAKRKCKEAYILLSKDKSISNLSMDLEKNIVFFSASSQNHADAITIQIFTSEMDTQHLEETTINYQGKDNQGNVFSKQIKVTPKPKNSAFLSVEIRNNTSNEAFIQQIGQKLLPYTAAGQNKLEYIQKVTGHIASQLANICNLVRVNELEIAHYALSNLEIPQLPQELEGFKNNTIACINRLKNTMYHNGGTMHGSLKRSQEIDARIVADIYKEYVDSLTQGIRVLDGYLFIVAPEQAKQLVDASNRLPGSEGTSFFEKYKPTKLFEKNDRLLNTSFHFAITNNYYNKAINYAIDLSQRGDFQKALEYGNQHNLFARYPELKTKIEQAASQKSVVKIVQDVVTKQSHEQYQQAEAQRLSAEKQIQDTKNLLANYLVIQNQYKNSESLPSDLAQIIDKRIEVLKDIQSNGIVYSEKSYTLSTNSKMILTQFELDASSYLTCHGSQLQQAIHQECLTTLEKITTLTTDHILSDYQESLLKINESALLFNKTGDIEQSLALLDFCNTIFDFGKAIAQGALEGIIETAKHITDNPVETATRAALITFAGEYLLAYELGKVVVDITKLGTLALVNPAEAKTQWQAYIKPIYTFIDQIAQKELTVRDCIRLGTKKVVQIQAESMMYNGLGSFYKTVAKKAHKLAINAPASIRDFPDSCKQVKNSFANNTPRQIARVHNMKTFFENFEFGRILKGKCNKTNLRYDGKTIYKMTEKIANSKLQKGDQLYIDALHLDHLEVFDSKGFFKHVLNLDGTINTLKTNQVAKLGRKI